MCVGSGNILCQTLAQTSQKRGSFNVIVVGPKPYRRYGFVCSFLHKAFMGPQDTPGCYSIHHDVLHCVCVLQRHIIETVIKTQRNSYCESTGSEEEMVTNGLKSHLIFYVIKKRKGVRRCESFCCVTIPELSRRSLIFQTIAP